MLQICVYIAVAAAAKVATNALQDILALAYVIHILG